MSTYMTAVYQVGVAFGLVLAAIESLNRLIRRCENCGKPLPGIVCEYCGWNNETHREEGK